MELSRRKFLSLAGGGAGILAAPGIGGLLAGHKGVEVGGDREESLWTIEAPSIPPAPRLEDDRKVDLAIIGAGYTGLSCAYYARRFMPDWSVIVLDSHRLGSGASSRNSGFVTEEYEGSSRSDMTLRGLERLRRFIEEEEIECDLAPATLTYLYSSKRSAEKARASMKKGEWISTDEVREGMGTSFYSGAVAPGGYSAIHPGKLVSGLAMAARRVGVELYEHSPVLEVKEGRPAELITPAARVKADHVLVATNPHTPRLGFLRSLS
jgi:glycine/D-amino acid oxidase-like deaminating enzyme